MAGKFGGLERREDSGEQVVPSRHAGFIRFAF
jgi:hypothetical protein